MLASRVVLVSFCTILVMLAGASNASAQLGLCPWTPSSPEPLHTDNNKIIEWGSTADNAGQGVWNLSTFVGNVDAGGPRNISWPVAGMRVENLKPQQFAVACHKAQQGRNDRSGPLFFARDRSSATTRIYSAGAPPATEQTYKGGPLEMTSDVVVSPKGGSARNGAVAVRVITTLQRTDKGFTITYALENLSSQPVLIEFPVHDQVAKLSDGRALLLKGSDKRTTSVETDKFPAMIYVPIQVAESSPDGALVIVPVQTARPAPSGRSQ